MLGLRTHDAESVSTLGVILNVFLPSVLPRPVPNMFTLCMSRGHPPIEDTNRQNRLANKQIKGGYLLRYRRGFFCKGWSEEWVVLYEDSTIAWYADKSLSRPRGCIRISEAPELLAVGEWTRQVPRKPRFSRICHVGQLMVVGSRIPHDVHWLMAKSPAEVNDWMTAISNTLPPPPHLPLEDKRCSLTPLRETPARTLPHIHGKNSYEGQTGNKTQNPAHQADYTTISGVAIDWGHGWGWGQGAWAVQCACVHDAAVNSSALYCHAVEDYALGGCDEVDWSAFGDFSF